MNITGTHLRSRKQREVEMQPLLLQRTHGSSTKNDGLFDIDPDATASASSLSTPTMHTWIDRDRVMAQCGQLMPETSSYLLKPRGKPKGTILAFHGFTAGTWQYKDLGKKFSAAGYNVYVPRLPGHGLGTVRSSNSSRWDANAHRIPSCGQMFRYEQFATQCFEHASSLDVPVHVVGLSFGAIMGFDLLNRFPNSVATATLCAPFFGPTGTWNQFKVRMVQGVIDGTCGAGASIIDRINFDTPWADKIDTYQDQQRWGHPNLKLGQMYTAVRYGEKVEKSVFNKSSGFQRALQKTPIQLLSTECDDIINRDPVRRLTSTLVKQQRYGHVAVCFENSTQLSHSMITHRSNPSTTAGDAVDRVHERAVDFVELKTRRLNKAKSTSLLKR